MLDNASKKIINILTAAGYKAYAVGGCVRDAIMGRIVSDYDIATSATPYQTETVLKSENIRFIETGIKHGTVCAIIEGKGYEITTFRTEGGYSDNRRPDEVNFVQDIKEDLSRRDFTVNAMAYSHSHGIVDLFGGQKDIQDKIIRTVGNPDLRFGEDALRIIRALRFASVLDFEIEEKTAQSIDENFKSLANVADERITTEVMKMISGKGFVRVFNRFFKVLEFILPQNDKIYKNQASDNILSELERLKENPAVLLAYLNVFETDEKLKKHASFGRLKLPSNIQKRVEFMVYYKNLDIPSDKTCVKLYLSKFGVQSVKDLAFLKNSKQTLKLIDDVFENNEPFMISHLDIGGDDLLSLGFKGKQIGELLTKILELVIKGDVPNDKNKIIEYIKNRL